MDGGEIGGRSHSTWRQARRALGTRADQEGTGALASGGAERESRRRTEGRYSREKDTRRERGNAGKERDERGPGEQGNTRGGKTGKGGRGKGFRGGGGGGEDEPK